MSTPKRAGDAPIKMTLEGGKTYGWCTCGHSENQPMCNGAHKTEGGSPLRFSEEETKEVYLCACKQTKNPPYCDGSHNN